MCRRSGILRLCYQKYATRRNPLRKKSGLREGHHATPHRDIILLANPTLHIQVDD